MGEVKNWRTYFTLSGLATSILLGLLPSLWDSVSDFAFAKKEETAGSLDYITPSTSLSTSLTHFFISLPLHVTAITGLQKILAWLATKCCNTCSRYRVCRGIAHLLSLAILVGLAVALFFLLVVFPAYFYFTAILSTIMVLSIKVTATVAHGPELKKLSTRMTSSESQYESSLQLILVLAICFKTGQFTASSISSLLSSVVMIGKSGAESYLTFGSENLLEQTGPGWRGLLKKLKLLAIYAPVFIATTSSRLTATAVVFMWAWYLGLFVFLPLSLAGPTLLLSILKTRALKDLSVVDLVKAVLGEQTTHTLWGGRGREGSRNLQMFMQVYLLLLHSSLLALVLLVISPYVGPYSSPTAAAIERLTTGAIVSLATGWLLSLPLFLVLYRNTATIQQSEDKREDCQGELEHLEDNRVNGNGEDEGVDGDGGGNGEDKAEDGEA